LNRFVKRWYSRLALCGYPALLLLCLCFAPERAVAQSTVWDPMLQDSHWYVPAENLLAYVASGSDLTNHVEAADQTIWTIGNSINGQFTGTSVATFKVGPLTSSSTTSMSGLITDAGQIRIAFTEDGGATTVGIGQVRVVDGNNLMEMQMISGGGGVYITHWAYMAAYDGDPDTLPPLEIESSLRSEEWNWMLGTSWSLSNDELFGSGQEGSFTIEGYRNGYFWGHGAGPDGSAGEDFTLLGSATPEGNILFNVLANGTLTSLTGLITGDASDGSMTLRSYDASDTFGNPGEAHVVPEPTANALLGLAAPVWFLAARRRLFGSSFRWLSAS